MGENCYENQNWCDGKASDAIAMLERAEDGFKRCDMSLYAAAALWRRGQLLGGSTGKGFETDAHAFFAAQGIVRPDRFLEMMAPGFGDFKR